MLECLKLCGGRSGKTGKKATIRGTDPFLFGLPSKSDGKRPSYAALERFFAERGMKGMRAALSNYRSKDVDPPNEVPRTKELEILVSDVKRLIPAFETDKVFLID
jgi:hypothetical protein